jgi:hypothetical protein
MKQANNLDDIWDAIPTTLRYMINDKRHVEVRRRNFNSTRRVVVPLTDLTDKELSHWAKKHATR